MLTENKTGLCEDCKELKPVGWTDSVGREYCLECFIDLHAPSIYRMVEYLTFSIPYSVGDRVRCYTAGTLYDGIGVVEEISMDPVNFGTPVYPSFRVSITEKAYEEAPDELWYTEVCLRKVIDE